MRENFFVHESVFLLRGIFFSALDYLIQESLFSYARFFYCSI